LKSEKVFAVLISIAVLVAFSVRLDYLLAGSIPQYPVAAALSKVFSTIGNGVFLFLACAALYAAGMFRKDNYLKSSGKEGVLALLLSSVFVHILKASFERPRIGKGADAIDYFLQNPSVFDLTGKYNSFPSGHTAASFAVAYVLAKKFPRFALFFYLIAFLVGISRVYLGSHYPTDVLAAAFLGVASGYLLLTKTNVSERWITAGVAILILFVTFFKSGGFLLFDIDEAVFSEAAREMVETGNLITPTYNYEPRYDKPILVYWFMSTAFKLFGTTEFAARFTSGLFGALLSFMTFLFVKDVKGLIPALLATLALVLNIEFFVYSHSAVTDMTLAFFITASLYAFYLGAHHGKERWFLWFWAASALAVLTKGAVGLLFPVAIAGGFILLSKRTELIRPLLRPSYIGLFLLISAPWFAVQFMVNGWEFFNAFIVKHHIKRYSDVISSHGGPFYYYFLVLLAGFFPWVAMLVPGIYRGLKDRLDKASGLYLLSAVWVLFVFIFFSISRTKLPNYIFPLFPAAAILSGLVMAEMIEGARRSKAGVLTLLVIAGLYASALAVIPSLNLKMDIYYPPQFFYMLAALFTVAAVISIVALYRPLPAFIGLASVALVLIVFLRLSALPPANIYLQKTLFDYSRFARVNLPSNGVLATYEINKPSIAFYARRGVLKADKTNVIRLKEYAKRTPVMIITTPSKYEEIKDYGFTILDSKGDYMLLGTEGAARFSPK
jgi:4-amino-4-deoxy-L-arabinose transferase-like glycosyltransferase/membrane-associated phospholipid phosphatase